MTTTPFLIAGEPRTGEGTFDVTNPFDDSVVETVGKPTAVDIEDAARAAADTFKESRNLPVHLRAEALHHVSRRLAERVDEMAELIAREGGKPLKWASVEAARAVSTFRIAAEECRRFDGEFLRLDTEASL